MGFGKVRAKIESYYLKDVFNCNESGLFYQLASDCTFAFSAFSGQKSQIARFTFVTCVVALRMALKRFF